MGLQIPTDRGTYKVVQFFVDGRPYMRFSAVPVEALDPYDNEERHADIVRRFAQEQGLPIEDLGDKVHFVYDDHQIVGAGHCRVSHVARKLRLNGTSSDYQIEIDPDHVKRLVKDLGGELKDPKLLTDGQLQRLEAICKGYEIHVE